MAGKTVNFTREGTPFEVFQIGKNYTEMKQHIMLTLEQMYEDCKKEGIIFTISKYENDLISKMCLHRLIDLGIIKHHLNSNGNIQYSWNCQDDPDFADLAYQVLNCCWGSTYIFIFLVEI